MSPQRVQLSRKKGARKPEGAVVVARPTIFGNPFSLRSIRGTGVAVDAEDARSIAVEWFRAWLCEPVQAEYNDVFLDDRAALLRRLPELAGRDLACWCPLDQPCHADVLLEIANARCE